MLSSIVRTKHTTFFLPFNVMTFHSTNQTSTHSISPSHLSQNTQTGLLSPLISKHYQDQPLPLSIYPAFWVVSPTTLFLSTQKQLHYPIHLTYPSLISWMNLLLHLDYSRMESPNSSYTSILLQLSPPNHPSCTAVLLHSS